MKCGHIFVNRKKSSIRLKITLSVLIFHYHDISSYKLMLFTISKRFERLAFGIKIFKRFDTFSIFQNIQKFKQIYKILLFYQIWPDDIKSNLILRRYCKTTRSCKKLQTIDAKPQQKFRWLPVVVVVAVEAIEANKTSIIKTPQKTVQQSQFSHMNFKEQRSRKEREVTKKQNTEKGTLIPNKCIIGIFLVFRGAQT